MSADKEIGKELLRQAANEGTHAGESSAPQVQATIHKARRRVHILAVTTLTLWSAVAAGAVGMVAGFFVFFWPKISYRLAQASHDRLDTFDWHSFGRIFWHVALVASLVWGALILLAALSTVAFTYASRSATLKQIQASLAEIAERLGPPRA